MAILGAKTFQNYIAGEWVDAASGETFESASPANGETIGVFPRSGAADVDRAVAAAKEAYEDWRLVPAPKRGEILFRFAQLLAENKEDLAQLMAREMGKVLPEARGDVQEAIDMAYYMGGEGRRLFGQTTPSELRDKFNMSVRQPIGVVGVITPWNFPIAIPSWKIPARARLREHRRLQARDRHAGARRALRRAADRGGRAGRRRQRRARGRGEVGNAIVTHPDVPVITLTGSRETGVQVTKDAADRLKHVHLELGGKNAIIVLDDADLDLAVDGIIWSAFGTSGQRCTAASRVIAHEAVYDALVSRLVAAAEKLRLGAGWEEDTDVGPVINQSALEKIHSYTAIGRDEGATLLTGGEVASGNGLDKGFYYRPTIFGDVDPGDADRPGGDLRADRRCHQGGRLRRGDPRLERDQVRALVLDLHPRREQGLPRHARPAGGNHLHQRRDDRRRGASAVRRHEGHRQRPPRGGPGRARRLHRVEVDLRRLLRASSSAPRSTPSSRAAPT